MQAALGDENAPMSSPPTLPLPLLLIGLTLTVSCCMGSTPAASNSLQTCKQRQHPACLHWDKTQQLSSAQVCSNSRYRHQQRCLIPGPQSVHETPVAMLPLDTPHFCKLVTGAQHCQQLLGLASTQPKLAVAVKPTWLHPHPQQRRLCSSPWRKVGPLTALQ